MIFPKDYKFVGIKDRERRGEKVYFSTEYLISRDGPSLYCVKSKGQGFMRDVAMLELVSSGQEIVFYPDIIDTRNRARLIEIAFEVCQNSNANTVVFQGPDEHITFIRDPDPSQILEIEVMDVAPPDPPWLVHVLRNLESCGMFGDLVVRFFPRILDLRQYDCEGVYYPCKASGLGHSIDTDPVVHEHPRIVGCEVSREIFLSNNPGKEFDFVNICPLHCSEEAFMPRKPFITRCCRSERRGLAKRNGQNGMVVHWGDGPEIIAEAVRCLVQEIRGSQ
jgi:hypothetical protein